mmetsp:Transcript_284/g.297  ORF Transcript_284/g.297 Transcript_284/m.297 type:complete len:94 (+) Transcript_284:239-520(+)
MYLDFGNPNDWFCATKGVGSIQTTTPTVEVGMVVDVVPDLSVDKCSHGGTGHVIGMIDTGISSTFTVKYDGSSVKSRPIWAATVTPLIQLTMT